MIDNSDTGHNPQHHIQRYILDVLRHTEYARFRDLRPPKVDSNAFSYHLTQLTKLDFVTKTDQGYTLSLHGIAYIDRVSRLDTRPRVQPKIMTITAIFNEHGQVFAYPKKTQPMIGKLTLPAGMLHLDDLTIEAAALREVYEKLGLALPAAEHAGDCYMAVRQGGRTIMNALMHVFEVHITEAELVVPDAAWWLAGARWCSPEAVASVAAPASARVLADIAARRPGERFFKEYAVVW